MIQTTLPLVFNKFQCHEGFCRHNQNQSFDIDNKNDDDELKSTSTNKRSGNHMIIIMIIMAIMFIGMCVALNLFSRYVMNSLKNFFNF